MFKPEIYNLDAPGMVAGGDGWALFLDLDGTLLDIAATPDSVIVPTDLITDLERLRARLDGALAVLSGRSMIEIDRLLFPMIVPAGAEHGSALRGFAGAIEQLAEHPVPPDWIGTLQDEARGATGVLIEVKSHAVALHFRLAEQEQPRFEKLARALISTRPGQFELMPARRAIEIRHTGIDKGRALHHLMGMAPFAGRRPLFIGDDVTDEDGIAAAEARGGLGLRVKDAFGGSPAAVRAWVKALAGG